MNDERTAPTFDVTHHPAFRLVPSQWEQREVKCGRCGRTHSKMVQAGSVVDYMVSLCKRCFKLDMRESR